MAGNTFGKVFRVTTWGESHGPALGAVIDGCPPRLALSAADIDQALSRRRPGLQAHATSRKEPDRVEILSGVFEGLTTGTPISLIIYNRDVRSQDYEELKEVFRPGHGDITYQAKYGLRDHRGGGRSSARETAARVAAGAVAQKVLDTQNITVVAYAVEFGGVGINRVEEAAIWENPFACPDPDAVAAMAARVKEIQARGDSVGGIVEVRAVKGVEIGSGFAAARLLGSENNDPIGPGGFAANRAGGILAGISNGDDIVMRAAVKPIPSISREQDTVDVRGQARRLKVKGRHDVSAIPRIVPVLEAMVRLTLADFLLRQKTIA
jgi:chorismate synthase